MKFHKLVGKEVVEVSMEDYFAANPNYPSVQLLCTKFRDNDASVSTVFLPIGMGRLSNPMFFETMIFGGAHDLENKRYPDYDSAVQGHRVMCEKAASSIGVTPGQWKTQKARLVRKLESDDPSP